MKGVGLFATVFKILMIFKEILYSITACFSMFYWNTVILKISVVFLSDTTKEGKSSERVKSWK